MPAVPDTIRSQVEPWFLGILDELKSRAWALSHGLRRGEREEFVCETVAWGWQWSLSAAKKGRLGRLTARTLAIYGARMFKCGRRFAGSSSGCVLSEQTRLKNHINVCSLQDVSDEREENTGAKPAFRALTDRRSIKPIDSARIRLDYALALSDPGLPAKAAPCFEELAQDNGPGHVLRAAKSLGVSPGRICQLKNSLAGALTRIDYGPRPSPDAA